MTALDPAEITDRLAAVERRLTDGETDDLAADAAAVEARMSELEARADEIDDRLAAVESGLDALRGLVGEVDRADEEVERRADAALAGVDDLETRVAALEAEETTDAALASEAAGVPRPPESAVGDDARERESPREDDRSLRARLRDAL